MLRIKRPLKLMSGYFSEMNGFDPSVLRKFQKLKQELKNKKIEYQHIKSIFSTDPSGIL